ncbi:disease resistance protein RPS5-like [Eucalyptus grandis]|uniref:disease resistance protein RPS5-like n=1 Tax=Eucalyptus grandis TaxID=71139 RepID=UPI00192EC666|nr:disease resistance protein RPS5-like [Eucalyptus grandis]
MNRLTNVGKPGLARVEVAEQEVLELERKYNKETVHAWRYARFWSRANLSKHMAKKREKLKVLLEEEKLDDGGVVKRSPSLSKARNIEKVQNAITQMGTKLKVEGGRDPVEIAQLINDELEGMRFLLLLDEVWDHLNLKEVGIPSNDKGSKVVFASRFYDLCHDMGAGELVHMNRLSDADAYKIFEEKVGQTMEV